MTIAEEILQEGIEQGIGRGIELGIERGMERGIERGLELGRQEGRQEGQRRSVLRLLAARLPESDLREAEAALSRVTSEDQLEDLLIAAWNATSLDVFLSQIR